MVGDSLCRYQYEIENVPWGSVRQQTRPIRPSMPMCLQASSYLIIYLVSSSLRLYSSCHKVYSIDSLLVGEFARQRVLIAVSIQKLWMRGGSSSVTFGAQLVVYTNCWQTKNGHSVLYDTALWQNSNRTFFGDEPISFLQFPRRNLVLFYVVPGERFHCYNGAKNLYRA